jgi:hypothetical protein
MFFRNVRRHLSASYYEVLANRESPSWTFIAWGRGAPFLGIGSRSLAEIVIPGVRRRTTQPLEPPAPAALWVLQRPADPSRETESSVTAVLHTMW